MAGPSTGDDGAMAGEGAPPPDVSWAPPASPASPASPPVAPQGTWAPSPAWPGHDPYGGQPTAGSRRRWPWVVGGVAIVLLGGAVVAAAVAGAGKLGELVAAGPEGETWISELETGDCYVLDEEDRREDVAGWVTTVPCSVPHDGEVFAVVPLFFDEWPGSRAASDAAEAACGDAEDGLDQAVYDQAGLGPTFYVPDEYTWDVDPHTAQCVVESDSALGLNRSWRYSAASATPSA